MNKKDIDLATVVARNILILNNTTDLIRIDVPEERHVTYTNWFESIAWAYTKAISGRDRTKLMYNTLKKVYFTNTWLERILGQSLDPNETLDFLITQQPSLNSKCLLEFSITNDKTERKFFNAIIKVLS